VEWLEPVVPFPATFELANHSSHGLEQFLGVSPSRSSDLQPTKLSEHY